ncbi:unnamed protein product [Owenia fusiformis]|uniref:Peroxisomal membrane protein PEX14 n=1 Tax=Owenia fusiformis TaxID=6347 RepID=A0A8J1USJ3_OWEFU|nr:unnamed protein product [Owenia fusiformis]
MASDGSDDPQAMSPAASPPVTQPRENLIGTAIKFLQNPQVRSSNFAQRKAFLEKKGLTSEEIDIAIERSGTSGDQNNPLPVQNTSSPVAQPPGQYQQGPYPQGQLQPLQPLPGPVSWWTRIKDFAFVVSAVYAVYALVKKYVIPYLMGKSAEEKQLETLQSSVNQLQNSMKTTLDKLNETLDTVNETVGQQASQIRQISLNTGNTAFQSSSAMKTTEASYVNEIKTEITSLKGLLLNRRQFPPTPASTPVIPAWQRPPPPALEDTSQEQDNTQGSPDTSIADNTGEVTSRDSRNDLQGQDDKIVEFSEQADSDLETNSQKLESKTNDLDRKEENILLGKEHETVVIDSNIEVKNNDTLQVNGDGDTPHVNGIDASQTKGMIAGLEDTEVMKQQDNPIVSSPS